MSEPVARLIEQRSTGAPRVHELGLGTHGIGRAAGVDVLIDHVDVSRRHAELEITVDAATIRDLGSKNGIVVDGRKVAEARLDDGARIGFGDLELILEHPGARIARVLQRGGEPTVRRPRRRDKDEHATASGRRPRVLAPALAAVVFALLLTLLLVYG